MDIVVAVQLHALTLTLDGSIQLHAPNALTPGKEFHMPNECEAG